MKKLISALAVLLLAGFVLVSCTANGSNEQQPQPTTTTTSVEEPAPAPDASEETDVLGTWGYVRSEQGGGTLFDGFEGEEIWLEIAEQLQLTVGTNLYEATITQTGDYDFLASDVTVSRNGELDPATPVDFHLQYNPETGHLRLLGLFQAGYYGENEISMFFVRHIIVTNMPS